MGRRGFFFRLYVYPTNWLSSTPISTRLGLAPLGLMAGAASGKWSKLRVILRRAKRVAKEMVLMTLEAVVEEAQRHYRFTCLASSSPRRQGA